MSRRRLLLGLCVVISVSLAATLVWRNHREAQTVMIVIGVEDDGTPIWRVVPRLMLSTSKSAPMTWERWHRLYPDGRMPPSPAVSDEVPEAPELPP